jgi:hypothetical protein
MPGNGTVYDFSDERGHDDQAVTLERVPLPDGVRRLAGWGHPRSSPARRWAHMNGGAYWIEDRQWLDHLYGLKYPDGRVCFRAEPYWLTDEGLDDLALLRADGWDVTVGGFPCHYPTTVVVTIVGEPPPAKVTA